MLSTYTSRYFSLTTQASSRLNFLSAIVHTSFTYESGNFVYLMLLMIVLEMFMLIVLMATTCSPYFGALGMFTLGPQIHAKTRDRFFYSVHLEFCAVFGLISAIKKSHL